MRDARVRVALRDFRVLGSLLVYVPYSTNGSLTRQVVHSVYTVC